MKKQVKNTQLKPSINEIFKKLSNITTLDELTDYHSELRSEIDNKFSLKEYTSNELNLKKLKTYEDKVSAVTKLFKEKIIMDSNLSLMGEDRNYHRDFQTYSFEVDTVNEKIKSYNEVYKKYFYLVWLKCKYRISRIMDWERLYTEEIEKRKFGIYIDENIKRYYTKLTDLVPRLFDQIPNIDYNQPENISITKQFLSKLIVSIESAQIPVDKEKFSESFGIKYDGTVRTAYNKVNKTGNAAVISFINNFWNYLADDEKNALILNFKNKFEPKH